MQVIESLPPIVALVLGLVLLAWLVLVFLVPFMIESIRQSTRRTHEELAEMNARLERLTAALSERGSASERAPAEPRAEQPGRDADRGARGRREPTISETDLAHERSRERREPVVR